MYVEWTLLAKEKRRSVLAYIAKRNPVAAREMNIRIRAAVSRVLQFPFSGRSGRLPDTRECVFHKNYLFVYRVKNDCIEIVAVLQTSEMWPPA